ncbi:MAG: YncE family protein [Actinomycetota bacterium]
MTTVDTGPHPGGIAINPVTKLAYVIEDSSTGRGGEVLVIDMAYPRSVATIQIAADPADVAVNSYTNKIYVSHHSFYSGSPPPGLVTVIDGLSNSVLRTVSVGTDPMALALDEGTNRIFTANHDRSSRSVTVIDGSTDSVISTLAPLPGQNPYPYDIVVDQSTDKVYVSAGLPDGISIIDAKTASVIGWMDGPPADLILAVDSSRGVLYGAEDHAFKLHRFDLTSQSLTTTLTTKGRFDAIATNPNTGRVYATIWPDYEDPDRSAYLLGVDEDTGTLATKTSIREDFLITGMASYSPTYRLLLVSNLAQRVVVMTEDAVPPISTLNASSPAMLHPGQTISGTVTDDFSGVSSVAVSFTSHTGTTTKDATVSCIAPTRLSCTWQTTVPTVQGGYVIQIQSTDRAGSVEPLGPQPQGRAGPYVIATIL